MKLPGAWLAAKSSRSGAVRGVSRHDAAAGMTASLGVSIVQLRKQVGFMDGKSSEKDKVCRWLKASGYECDENGVDVFLAAGNREYGFLHAAEFFGDMVLARLQEEYFIFSEPPNGHDALVAAKILRYLRDNDVTDYASLTLHDGAKRTLVANNAPDVLKIYPSYAKGVYDKERWAYDELAKKGADMTNFVAQYAWDDASLTARAARIANSHYNGDREGAMDRILDDLARVGLTMTDLNHGDNIGTSLTNQAIVFDVKSLKPLVPQYDKKDQKK